MRTVKRLQVWLIKADFIDLSTNKSEWTFSKVWDLRLGRISSANNIKDVNTLADLMKHMLNTPFIAVSKDVNPSTKIYSLELDVEDNQKAVLNFFEHDNKYYVSYSFKDLKTNSNLQKFSNYVRGNFYEIAKTDLEKIKDDRIKQGAR